MKSPFVLKTTKGSVTGPTTGQTLAGGHEKTGAGRRRFPGGQAYSASAAFAGAFFAVAFFAAGFLAAAAFSPGPFGRPSRQALAAAFAGFFARLRRLVRDQLQRLLHGQGPSGLDIARAAWR